MMGLYTPVVVVRHSCLGCVVCGACDLDVELVAAQRARIVLAIHRCATPKARAGTCQHGPKWTDAKQPSTAPAEL